MCGIPHRGASVLRPRASARVLASGLAVSLAGVCGADDRFWINPGGGAFSTPSNWAPGVVPGPNDRPMFPINGTYTVTITSPTSIGALLATAGNVTLTMGGSSLVSNGEVVVADQASEIASLAFSNGSFSGRLLEAGRSTGSQGAILFDGASCILSEDLLVGRRGTGSATFRAGANYSQTAGNTWIAFNNFSSNDCVGHLTFDNANADITYDLNASFGLGCQGDVHIVNGSHVSVNASIFGLGTGSEASLEVSGNGTLYEVRANQFIMGAEHGTGSLDISSGAHVDALFCWLGSGPTSEGSAVIRDPGSRFHTQWEVTAGRDGGTGTLHVEPDARLEAGSLAAGAGDGATGEIVIRGAEVVLTGNAGAAYDNSVGSILIDEGSTFVSNGFEIGHGGVGSLTVRGGSHATWSGMGLGYRSTGEATVLVSDPGTVVTGVGTVGSSRPTTFTVQNGAHLLSGPQPSNYAWNDYIGIDSVSSMTITGPGTRWDNINGLWIGGIYFETPAAGHGTLRLLDGAGASGESVAVGAGATAADTGQFEVDATSRFDSHFGFTVGHADAPPESSEILLSGGTLGGSVRLNAGGLLRGSGTIDLPPTPSSNVLYSGNGGVCAPGIDSASPIGSFTFNGLGTAGSSTIRMDIRAAGPSGADHISFGGAFTAGGRLEISLGGFLPEDGASWDLITAPTITGQFTEIIGAGYVGKGRYVVVEQTATAVRARCIVVSSVRIEPASLRVAAGFLGSFHAIASTPSGDLDFTSALAWSSDDDSTATIERAGVVRGQSAGSTTVHATTTGFAVQANVLVDPLPVPSPTERVSLSDADSQLAEASFTPSISGDGRLVAFDTRSTDVVSGPQNGAEQVYLRDMVSGTTGMVSVTPAGLPGNDWSFEGELSRSGSHVSFYSYATDLVPGDTNTYRDVFIRDLGTGVTELVSVGIGGAPANLDSFLSAVSADGSRVVFLSIASNLVANDTNNSYDAFVRNRTTGQTTRLSVSANGSVSGGATGSIAISDNGRFVVFETTAALVPADTNNQSDLYLRDLTAGTIERVSVGPGGVQGNLNSQGFGRIVSNDGRYVLFQSFSTNFVPNDTNNARDVFIRDRQLGTTTLVNARPDGTPTAGGVGSVSLSGNGRIAAWRSPGSNVVPFDTNGANDVFVKDLVTGHTRRASVSPFGDQGDGASSFIDISSDGSFVVFESTSTNIAPFDTNNRNDIFRRRVTVPICPADVNSNGQVNSQDFFDFLSAFFNGAPSGDFNADGVINSQDFFDFLNSFFNGC